MTPAQKQALKIGLLAALAGVAAALVQGTVTPTRAGFQSCVPFPPGWVDDGGMSTARVESVRLSHAALVQLGFPAGSPAYAYGSLEVQGYPAFLPDGVTPDYSQMAALTGIDLCDDSQITLRASPLQPTCQVAVRLQGAASPLFQCACAVDATCLVSGSPALQGVTLAPGTWSGAGCLPKPCTELLGSSSWPAACPGGS